MKRILFSILGLTGTVLLLSCVNDSSGGGSGSGANVVSYSFSVSGNQLIQTNPAVVGYYCSSTAVISDTLPSTTDTITYQITGNTLEFVSSSTLPSGAVVNQILSFQRVGSGSGLTGTWKSPSYSYVVVSGTMTYGDSVSFNQNDVQQNLTFSFQNEQITFSGTTATVSTDPDYSGQFIATWNGELGAGSAPDSSVYNVSVQAIDKNTVELKGLTNNETVKITQSSNGDVDYSSSVAADSASHYVLDPTSCPDPYQPNWYSDFLGANAKVSASANAVAKSGIQSQKPRHLYRLPFGILFTH